jgi:hypothetical protein
VKHGGHLLNLYLFGGEVGGGGSIKQAAIILKVKSNIGINVIMKSLMINEEIVSNTSMIYNIGEKKILEKVDRKRRLIEVQKNSLDTGSREYSAKVEYGIPELQQNALDVENFEYFWW